MVTFAQEQEPVHGSCADDVGVPPDDGWAYVNGVPADDDDGPSDGVADDGAEVPAVDDCRPGTLEQRSTQFGLVDHLAHSDRVSPATVRMVDLASGTERERRSSGWWACCCAAESVAAACPSYRIRHDRVKDLRDRRSVVVDHDDHH